MFRIILTKVPLNILKDKRYHGSKLCKSVRCYSKSDKQSVCPPPTPQPGNSGAIYTVGAITLIGGGTIAYAKYDREFRIWLNEHVPYSDSFIKFIFQEDQTYIESFIQFLDAIKNAFLDTAFGRRKKRDSIPVEPKDYNPPPPAFSGLAEESKATQQYAEIRVEEKHFIGEPTVTIGGEKKQPPEALPPDHPKSVFELERFIGITTSTAIQQYNKAIYVIKNYDQDVRIVIEDSPDRIDHEFWIRLREKRKDKEAILEEAAKTAKQARKAMNRLEKLINDPTFDAPDTLKQQALLNIKSQTTDLEIAEKQVEREKRRMNVTQHYWKKVEEARNHFIDEIEILFPSVNISEKKMELQGPELDLFIIHVFSRVLYYQKELSKLQTIEDNKVQTALEAARKGNKDILSDAQIEKLVEKEKQQLVDEYQKKCLCLRVDSERELRRQLKLQSEAFSDHLNDALKIKEMEMNRRFAREMDEVVTEERCKFKLQLSALAGRVRGMDQALKVRAESDKYARQAQILWSACQALFRALRAGCPGMPWPDQLRPLEPEILAVREASAAGDELVQVVLDGIPVTAKERGVYPEDALRERFLKVERACRRLALIPEGGARLPLHFLSYVYSTLLLNAASPIPQAELEDNETDFSKLSTNDILQRARYWMDRGDFAQTLRYMNLLEGAPRCAARDWMYETRILLETQQAANTLMAHAAANGLLYL